MAAEAVVFFDRAAAAHMAERRKRAGHLLSKHRFLSLQFDAFLKDDCWLRLARHANAMADRLAAGLAKAGLAPVWPVEANLVFVQVPKAARGAAEGCRRALLCAPQRKPAAALAAGPDRCLIRLVASFATTRRRGRSRSLQLPQRGDSAAPAVPQSAANARDRDERWRDFRETAMGLCGALGARFFRAGRPPSRCSSRRPWKPARCRRTKFSPSCARPASIRSAGRSARSELCAARDRRRRSRGARHRQRAARRDSPHRRRCRPPSRMPPRGGAAWGLTSAWIAMSALRLLPATSRPTAIATARVRRSSTTMTTICRRASRRRVRLANVPRPLAGPSGRRAAAAHRLRRSAAGHQGYAAGSGLGRRARHRSAAAVFRRLCRLRPARGS